MESARKGTGDRITDERFRRLRQGRQILGCFLLLVLLPILIPYVALYLLVSLFGRLLLYVAVFAFWLPRGKDTLFVYWNSPHWKENIEASILPAIRRRAVMLNWSERATWRQWSLAVSCFRHFGGGRSSIQWQLYSDVFEERKCFVSGDHSANSNTGTPHIY